MMHISKDSLKCGINLRDLEKLELYALTCMHAQLCTDMHTRNVHAHKYTHVLIHTHTCTRMHARTHAHTYTVTIVQAIHHCHVWCVLLLTKVVFGKLPHSVCWQRIVVRMAATTVSKAPSCTCIARARRCINKPTAIWEPSEALIKVDVSGSVFTERTHCSTTSLLQMNKEDS